MQAALFPMTIRSQQPTRWRSRSSSDTAGVFYLRVCCLTLVLGCLLVASRLLQPTTALLRVTAAHTTTATAAHTTTTTALAPNATSQATRAVRPPLQDEQDAERYAYGVSAPLELPSPPPPGDGDDGGMPPGAPAAAGGCRTDPRYDRYLRMKGWEGQKARTGQARTSYLCYQHRDVAHDVTLGRSTCRKPYNERSCPVRQPTFPAPAEGCLCCPMAGHACPPCWGCLLPLSRRRVFAGKLYERETGGTANVFLAREALPDEGDEGDEGDEAERSAEFVFKLRDGEVGEDERENTRLVNALGADCGLLSSLVAREWVAELAIVQPGSFADAATVMQPNASMALMATATRRPAVVAELARGVSTDILLRTRAQGPNKQEAHGRSARSMIHQLRRIDSRGVVRAALFDALFASGDRHLEHVLLREDGGLTLIDNAHMVLAEANQLRHQANSVFLPGSNFHSRNRLGFPFLHCCTLRSVCPQPKPDTCPGTHTLYWPALLLDYRCHVPRGRLGTAFPPRTHRCLRRLAEAPPSELSARYGGGGGGGGGSSGGSSRGDARRLSRKLEVLRKRAALLLRFGLEGALRREDHGHGYYLEGHLHNLEATTPPCCSLTLDGPTGNRQSDEWRCHTMTAPELREAQWRDDGRLAASAALGSAATAATATAAAVASPRDALLNHLALPPPSPPGRVAAAELAGALYTVSVERDVPTNRSLTPTRLQDELGRKGDWIFPGRVDLFWQAAPRTPGGAAPSREADHAEGVDAAPMVAVAAGRGLWAAITARGDALLCIFPCLALVRLDGAKLRGGEGGVGGGGAAAAAAAAAGLVGVAVGNLSAYFLDASGAVYAAAMSNGHGQRGGALVRPKKATTRLSPQLPSLPKLGGLVAVGGALAGVHVVHVAAAPHATLALSADGAVYGWGLLWDGAAEGGARPPRGRKLTGRMPRGRAHRAPRRLQLPFGVGAARIAAAQTHWMLMTSDGRVLSASLPSPRDAFGATWDTKGVGVATPRATEEPRGLGRPGPHHALSIVPLSLKENGRGARAVATAVAAGDGFSLALVREPQQQQQQQQQQGGTLVYWAHGEAEAATDKEKKKLPSRAPRPAGAWHRPFRSTRFVLLSACARHVLALSTEGDLFSWSHGATSPARTDSVKPMAVTAMAAGETLGLLLSPAFDMRADHPQSPADMRAAAAAAAAAEAAAAERPLLGIPAPFPRPVLTRGDNVGIHELVAAKPDAMAAATDGFNRSMRTPCWRPGARAARCPLVRAADCASWFGKSDGGGGGRGGDEEEGQHCLPALLLLGGRSCGVRELASALGRHPDVTVAASSDARGGAAGRHVRPWWSHPSLDAFRTAAVSRRHVQALEAAPATQLLLQWGVLDAEAAGLSARLWDANVSLADLLPRVQPSLQVVLLVCEPLQRLRSLSRPPPAAALLRQARAFDACARDAPAPACARRLGGDGTLLDGAYALWARELARALPEQQLRVLRAEDLRRSPRDVLRALHDFAGLRAHDDERDAGELTLISAAPRAAGAPAGDGEWSASAVARLRDFYEPYNVELAHLMDGDPRFLW